MDLVEKIKQLALPLLTEKSQFVVSVVVSSLQGPQKVTVILDGDNGVTIDDCAGLSRLLLTQLEELGLIGENFTLEVTTPGLDRPLKLKRQFFKNIGRGVRVHLMDKRIVEGKLTDVTEEKITLDQEVREGKKSQLKTTAFFFPDIEKVFVQISFK